MSDCKTTFSGPEAHAFATQILPEKIQALALSPVTQEGCGSIPSVDDNFCKINHAPADSILETIALAGADITKLTSQTPAVAPTTTPQGPVV